MPRHGEQEERLGERAGVGVQWRRPQNEVKAESIVQLKTASYCTCTRTEISIALTILILSLPTSKTLPLLDFFGLTVKWRVWDELNWYLCTWLQFSVDCRDRSLSFRAGAAELSAANWTFRSLWKLSLVPGKPRVTASCWTFWQELQWNDCTPMSL